MLEVKGLRVRYGAIEAIKGIDIAIAAGEIVALIGANGAGKTTTLKALGGLLRYTGEIRYDGALLDHVPAERLVRRGLVLVPEGRGILGQMSVRENLLMGAYARTDRAASGGEMEAVLARFPVLRQRLETPATLLSGGEQQMLALGRALMAKPRLLMLDEPSLGLAPAMVTRVFGFIEELRRGGLTILLVEQKARQTLKIADRAYVLETGRVIAQGAASALAQGTTVADAFLGGTAETAAV